MLARFRRDKTPTPSRYTYPIHRFLGIDAKSEQASLPLGYAAYAYNIAFKDEKLTTGFGLEKGSYFNAQGVQRDFPNLNIQTQFFKSIYLYRKYDYEQNKRADKLLVHTRYNRLYACDFAGSEFVNLTQDSGIAEGVDLHPLNYHHDGEDVLLIYQSTGGAKVYDGQQFSSYPDVPKASSVCLHYERAWLAEKEGNKLYFSTQLDPTDFTVETGKGGYISFPDDGGALLKVISFKDYIFIFREFCIHRLSAYADPTDYKLTRVFVTNNKIHANLIQATSDKIIFYADDGFYAFDGFVANKVYERFTPLIESVADAAVCFYDQKYMVALRLKNLDGSKVGDEALASYKNNCVVAFDQLTGSISIMRGVDINCFLPINIEKTCGVYASLNNFRGCYIYKLTDDGKLDGTPLKKFWTSSLSNLASIDRYKVLRNIFVSCLQKAVLTVVHDEGQSIYYLKASAKPQRLPVNKKCDSVAISIASDEEHFFVGSLQLTFDTMRYYYANN